MKKLIQFIKNEKGASGVEYGILLGTVSAGIIAIAFALGVKVQGLYAGLDNLLP